VGVDVGRRSFTTFSARVGKLTARNRPVQMELYFGYRTEMAGGHDFQELDFGIGGRVLPQRPLFYTKNTAIRPTASASIGWSLASFDLPLETSAGLAICDNTGKFTGIMVELVARPTNEAIAKQSNTVADEGKPGVVDLGPWVGGRLMVFW